MERVARGLPTRAVIGTGSSAPVPVARRVHTSLHLLASTREQQVVQQARCDRQVEAAQCPPAFVGLPVERGDLVQPDLDVLGPQRRLVRVGVRAACMATLLNSKHRGP